MSKENALFIFHKPSANGVVIHINGMIEDGLIDSPSEFTDHGVCDLITHPAVREVIRDIWCGIEDNTEYDVTWYLELN
jgi:hypothetical protein